MSASWKLLLETWSFLGKLCMGFPIIIFINLQRLSKFQMAYWDAEKSKTQWQKWQHKVKKLPDTLDPPAFFASFAGRPAGCIDHNWCRSWHSLQVSKSACSLTLGRVNSKIKKTHAPSNSNTSNFMERDTGAWLSSCIPVCFRPVELSITVWTPCVGSGTSGSSSRLIFWPTAHTYSISN